MSLTSENRDFLKNFVTFLLFFTQLSNQQHLITAIFDKVAAIIAFSL